MLIAWDIIKAGFRCQKSGIRIINKLRKKAERGMGIRMNTMNMNETIKRINELYHKSQAEGLSEEEKAEQKMLRQKYIDSVRGNLRGQLENMSIQRPDGSIEKVKKIK